MPRNSHSLSVLSGVLVAALTVVLWEPVSAGQQDGFQVDDPHYGEVLFYFYQQQHFTALTKLMVSRDIGRVSHHEAEAELLQGGLLLSWGQHEEAGEIFERLLADTSDQSVRDRTWFYLGKVRDQRGYIDAAERAFENIRGSLPTELEAERYNLLARLYMDQGRFADAVAVLSEWEGTDIWMAYARYNLGVALVRMGELEAGAGLLDKVGMMWAYNEEELALRDRANLALGFAYLQADLNGDAKPVLQRVRLNGPYSNKALLGTGWADTANNEYRKALVPWLELSKRDLLDSAVQESLLAVPYAFAQLDAEPQAAEYYARALDIFGAEIVRLDLAMQDAGNGQLVNALLAQDQSPAGGWFWQLDSLPDDNRTRYLYFAIADHRFHEGLKSYRDLVSLDEHLDGWRTKLTAYRDMLATRKQAYAERLPVMHGRIATFDLAGMQETYTELQQRTIEARAEHDIVALATADEQAQWARLIALERNSIWATEMAAPLREKQRVLKGLLVWDMEREFRVRAWRQDEQIKVLGHELGQTVQSFISIDAAVDSIPETVLAFDSRIALLKPKLDQIQRKLQLAMARHSVYLHGIALDEMQAQRQRLMTYQAQARFALASIYDRMSASNE